ncbi:MAG TPA: VWA domain-containing protein [candidate division Zixibacteria bacterium]|nr:VWA domain-containing protein [candidate division Zixibacteria bacterium]
MIEQLLNIDFARPTFLWFLAALPLLWLRLRQRSLAVIVLRSVVVTLLVLTLADPQISRQQTKETREERMFAFDVSASIPAEMRTWMAREAAARFPPRSGDRVFLFGGMPVEADDWAERLQARNSAGEPTQPDKTNLQRLFETIVSLRTGPRDLYLFTDGWETEGDVRRLLPRVAAAGVRVFPIVPVTSLAVSNVAVSRLIAPSHGESGDNVSLKVVLENQGNGNVEGTLTLSRNDHTIKTERIQLGPGSRLFRYEVALPEGGALATFRATFTPSRGGSDAIASDNQAHALVAVRSKAKVLLLNGRPGGGRYLEELLKRQGFEVHSRSATQAPPSPEGYNVVIFNNVERERFPASYLAAVERHVASGNSFVMLGSEWSFGPGGYRGTPVETILPVELKEPKKEEHNRAVVLVIDKSGSMREDNRILFAQEAAKAVANQLKDNDLLGVIGFDVSPFVVVPVDAVGRLRGRFAAQVDRLKPGGQTYFFPALVEAKRQLEKLNAGRKHVILLSDGETRGSQGELIDLVSVMKSEMKITVSAIAIGPEADIRIMKRISQYGGGLFHHTADPSSLPRIALQQLQEKGDEEPPAERDWMPVQEKGSEILAGFSGAYPPIRGQIETELKKGASLDLSTPRNGRKLPLMASWRYGKGKSVALTMDMEGRWSRNWIPWGGLTGFWGKILGWLQPPVETVPPHEARINVVQDRAVLDLYVYDEASLESRFSFVVNGKGVRTDGSLKRVAPGHYQTQLPLRSRGDYRIDIAEERRGMRRIYPPIGYTLPYDLLHELPRNQPNLPLLTELAEATGGELNPSKAPRRAEAAVIHSYQPLRSPLIAAVFALFLLEVAVRRLIYAEN